MLIKQATTRESEQLFRRKLERRGRRFDHYKERQRPRAAIANVQTVNIASGSSGTFFTVASTGLHHLLAVTVSNGTDTATVASIVWTVGNGGTWVQVPAARSKDSASVTFNDIWYVKDSSSGGTEITITITGGSGAVGITFYEFSGTDLGNVDQVNALSDQAAPGAQPFNGAPVTTGMAGEVILSVLSTASNVTAVAGGFTLDQADANGSGHASDITSGSGTFTPSWTCAALATWASSTASFKPAAGGSLLTSMDFVPGAGGCGLPPGNAVAW